MPKRRANKPAAGGSSSGAVAREDFLESNCNCNGCKRISAIYDAFQGAAEHLGLSPRTLDLQRDESLEGAVTIAATCRKAADNPYDHEAHQESQFLTWNMDQLLTRFTEWNLGLSLEADAVLKRSFFTHCMLTFELDSIAHHSILNDPHLSAKDIAVRLTLLAHICEFPREMQLKAQKLLPPGKLIPEACLLEPSHSEAKQAKIMWDPALLTTWFKSMLNCRGSKEGEQVTFYLFGKVLKSVSKWSFGHPDRHRIDEVLKDAGFMRTLWAALGSTSRLVLEVAIPFLHLCIQAAPEHTRLVACTGTPPAASMHNLLQMGALDALTAVMKQMHHLVVEEQQDKGNDESKSKPGMTALCLSQVLLVAIKSAKMLDYQAATAQECESACTCGHDYMSTGKDFDTLWPRDLVKAHMQLCLLVMESCPVGKIEMEAISGGPQDLIIYPEASRVMAMKLFLECKGMGILIDYLQKAMLNEDYTVRYSQAGSACLFLRQMMIAGSRDPHVEAAVAVSNLYSAFPMDALMSVIARALEAAHADSALHTSPADKHSWGMQARHALQLLYDMLCMSGGWEAFHAHAADHEIVLKACDLIDFQEKAELLKASKGQRFISRKHADLMKAMDPIVKAMSKIPASNAAASRGASSSREGPSAAAAAKGSKESDRQSASSATGSSKSRAVQGGKTASASSPSSAASGSSSAAAAAAAPRPPGSVGNASPATHLPDLPAGGVAPKQAGKARTCAACGKVGKGMKCCSRCRQVWFCDVQCQAVAWRTEHKRSCKAPASTSEP